MAADQHESSGHTIVCGLGHVGHWIVCLLARLGVRGVVITREMRQQLPLAAAASFRVIQGDARDEKLLCQAGIERATAILAVTDDDLANVSIALDARRINPQIAVVVRLFDQELAAHLQRLVEINRALSASALAAPAFVAAAMGAAARGAFEAGGASWIIEQQVVEESPAVGTIGAWAAATGRTVIALRRGEQTTLRPTPTAAVLPGDRLTSLRLLGGDDNSPAAAPAGGRRPTAMTARRALIVGMRQWWRDVPAALRTALIALLAVVALSVLVFHVGLAMPLVDSLYFVITTVTTVGYGDFSLKDAPTPMKLYGSFLMLCGAAIIATLFGILTNVILGTRLRDVIAHACAECKGHVIVAGLGNIGFRLVRDLVASGEMVVAIEHHEDGQFVQAARELAPVVLGNARMEETLRRAGVAGAKAVIAATDDDLANLSIGLASKRANPSCRAVLRLFDAELAEKMQSGLGIDAVLSVSAAAAPTFVGAALCGDVLQGILLQDGLVAIFARKVNTDLPSVGPGAAQPDEHELALFVKRARSAAYEILAADAAFRAGDQIIGARWYPFQSNSSQP